jgi:hypothetical protein
LRPGSKLIVSDDDAFERAGGNHHPISSHQRPFQNFTTSVEQWAICVTFVEVIVFRSRIERITGVSEHWL